MFDHILIPVAPGHQGEYARALSVARRLVGSGGKISVLSVLEEIPAYIGTYIPPDQLEKNLAAISHEVVTEFGDEDVEIHVISGHSANSILTWAEKNDVDCIIVTSHRPGLSDYFIGSTAARVVRHAQCPVVVLR